MYLIRQADTKNYYSGVLDGKHCIYGFRTRMHAIRCKNFLYDYRDKHKRYPTLDQQRCVKYLVNNGPLYIESEEVEDMKVKCAINSVHLFEVHTFDYGFLSSRNDISLSGQHLTEDVDAITYETIDNLEHLFKLSD